MKQRLIFGEGLMVPTIEGGKKTTIRKYRAGSHDFEDNELICGEFMDGLSIILRIVGDPEKKRFSEITNKEAQKYGYEDAEDLFNGIKEYYTDLKKTDMSIFIHYEILTAGGDPVVKFNKHAEKNIQDI